VWRVNGNPGIDADFADVPDAVAAASSGDTIYVEPWIDGIYGTTTVDKPLTIIGTGYYLTENDSTQYIDQWTNINRVVFAPGSAGSKISGVQFVNQGNYNAGSSVGRFVNGSVIIDECCITLEKCFSNESISVGLTALADNCVIQNCYFYNFSPFLSNDQGGAIDVGDIDVFNNPALEGTGVQNTVINNSITGEIRGDFSGQRETIVSMSVNNCVIHWTDNNNPQTRNTIFSNCIFINLNDNIAQSNVSFFNNIATSDEIPTGNGNQLNVPFATIFDASTFDHPELRFKLAPGSPATGAAIDGGDCGIFGGDFPYVLSGMPNIPSIFSLTVDPTAGGNEQTLDVNLKAKSHE
jgi:hypothetical protein